MPDDALASVFSYVDVLFTMYHDLRHCAPTRAQMLKVMAFRIQQLQDAAMPLFLS